MKLKDIKLSNFLNKEFLILGVFVLIGSFLRLQGVLTNSFAYTYDVGRDMLALYNIVVNHDLMFIGATTGIQGVFYGPWWYYMLTPFFVIFQGDPAGIAFTMALFGIASILIAYLIGKKIGGNFLAISFAILTSVSPALISLSAQIWNPNIAPLFVLLSFFCLYKIYTFEKKASNKYFFLIGLFLAINIDLEILWGLLFSLSVIASLIIVLNKKIKIKQIIFFALGALIIATPRIFFELKHGFLMTKSFIAFLLSKNSTEDPLTFLQILENRVFSFFDLFTNSLSFNNQILGLSLIIFIVTAILFFYRKSSDIIKKFIVTQVTILLVFFAGTVIFSRALWPHYLVGLPVVYIFLFSLSLYLVYKRLNVTIPAFIIILLLIVNLDPVSQIKGFNTPLFEGNASVYRNQLAVVDYVYRQANGKDFKYVVYTPPVFDYTYRYLFMWYGPKIYHYSTNEEARTAFFIIEPDPGYEDRPKWWLRDRENDGKIIKLETLKGGIVVQTRIH